MSVTTQQSTRIVRERAATILAPMTRILVTIGLSKDDLLSICEREFGRTMARTGRRRFNVVERNPRYPDIITRWVTHPRYHDNGRPAMLRPKGRAPSFASLVDEIEPSLSSREVLEEWRRLKIVRVQKDGKVGLLKRHVPTRSGNDLDIGLLSAAISDLLRAFEFNVLKRTRAGKGLFQRHALSYNVDPRLAPTFNQFARDQAELLLESVDDWLARHERPRPKRRYESARLGLGIYVVNEALR